jgi:hypothetical protein
MHFISNSKRELLRHIIAVLVYRVSKILRDAPKQFATFRVSPDSRSPGEILEHIGDLFDWALSKSMGKRVRSEPNLKNWNNTVSRFYNSVRKFDMFLANENEIDCPVEKLLQGPIADALTHVGQLAMIRRLVGAPVKGENYFDADIAIGRIGPEQSHPIKEFD